MPAAHFRERTRPTERLSAGESRARHHPGRFIHGQQGLLSGPHHSPARGEGHCLLIQSNVDSRVQGVAMKEGSQNALTSAVGQALPIWHLNRTAPMSPATQLCSYRF